MRVSRAQAEANRERVIEVASRLFRLHGFDGIGLADVMKAAGLTQGGFYKQFASKEDLVAKASGKAVKDAQERWRSFADQDPNKPLTSLARGYLSVQHRDEQAEGCTIAALGADAARAGPAVRASLEEGVRDHISFLEDLLPEEATDRRERAMTLLSTMVGALVLSRAVEDLGLSVELLEVAMKDVIGRGEGGPITQLL